MAKSGWNPVAKPSSKFEVQFDPDIVPPQHSLHRGLFWVCSLSIDSIASVVNRNCLAIPCRSRGQGEILLACDKRGVAKGIDSTRFLVPQRRFVYGGEFDR